MRKSFLCSLCVLLALALAAPAVAEPTALTCGVRDIQVFGNLVLDLAPAALAEAGYEYGDVLSLTVDTNILLDWKEGDEVILYYTGEFGENMEVHYIDKWTENSEVQRPENKDKNAQAETGGSVVE